MKTISQIARFRQSVVGYSQRFSIQEAMNRFNVSRATVYRWRKRYDGSVVSLMDRSRRPHHHPKQHTEEELKLIFNMRKRSPHLGLVVFWVKITAKRIYPLRYLFMESFEKAEASIHKAAQPKICPENL